MPVNAKVESLLERLADIGEQLAEVNAREQALLDERKAVVDAIYAESPPRQAPVTRMQMALRLTSREMVQKIKAKPRPRPRQRTQRVS